jgi:hypothetical protein
LFYIFLAKPISILVLIMSSIALPS